MGEQAPTWANRSPNPGISPKWVNRLFFVVLWPIETVDKNQFYIFQNALKLTCSNLNILHNSPPDSWPICFTVGAERHFGGLVPLAHAWRHWYWPMLWLYISCELTVNYVIYDIDIHRGVAKILNWGWPLSPQKLPSACIERNLHLVCLAHHKSELVNEMKMIYHESIIPFIHTFFWLWQKWVFQTVQCHTGLTHPFNFSTFGHSGAQSWAHPAWSGRRIMTYFEGKRTLPFAPTTQIFGANLGLGGDCPLPQRRTAQ